MSTDDLASDFAALADEMVGDPRGGVRHCSLGGVCYETDR